MERGLYIAATGMMSAITRQDTIASNLANVNTVGYKTDRVVNETFNDMFVTSMKLGGEVGEMNFGTRVAGVVTDFSQGYMRNTGNATDLAIGGDGFFMVQAPGGPVQYTRNGQFNRSADGFLTTQSGEFVLSSGKTPLFVGPGDPTISSDGRVYTSDGQLSGQIGLMRLDFENSADQIRKTGASFWTGPEAGAPPIGSTSVRQGFVEASGVNSIKEMVEMIGTMRGYESAQRAVLAIDGTLDKAVNSVGSLNA